MIASVLIFTLCIKSNAQSVNSESIIKANEKIRVLKIERDNISKTMQDISSDKIIYNKSVADGSWNKYLASRAEVDVQIAEWEKIKFSLENNSSTTNLEKVKISKAEFDALPEANQKAILSEPNRFEIVK